jgi:8-oxo-dGTP diphosphatase
MRELLHIRTSHDAPWLPPQTEVATFLCDELPPLELCSSVYGLVFKDGALLQSDQREGERPTRRLDIPGGHLDPGEHPERGVIRETFEETGVHVHSPRLIGYKRITVHGPKPEGSIYPHPTSYLLFYRCDVAEETPFEGNHEVHGRVWLAPHEHDRSPWCVEERAFLEAVARAGWQD